jgi:hypothetical protein
LDTTEYPQAPLAPCGLVRIAIPVSLIQQDKLTRAFLISQQVVSYRTHGGAYCPGVSILKIWSSADSSTTSHYGINHLDHSIHCSNHSIDSHHDHLTHERRKTKHSHKDTSQTQYHKRWETCMTLMSVGLSKSTNHKIPS